MATTIYLPEAIEDLHSIWQYIYEQAQSAVPADRVISMIADTAETYACRPDLGILRPELVPEVRCFPVGRYVVFYVPVEGGLEIVQVIHGSRDLPRHWRGIAP